MRLVPPLTEALSWRIITYYLKALLFRICANFVAVLAAKYPLIESTDILSAISFPLECVGTLPSISPRLSRLQISYRLFSSVSVLVLCLAFDPAYRGLYSAQRGSVACERTCSSCRRVFLFLFCFFRSDISAGSRRGIGTVDIGGLAITGAGSPKPGGCDGCEGGVQSCSLCLYNTGVARLHFFSR